MADYSALIILIWLIPAVLQIGIPLLMLVAWLIYHIPIFAASKATEELKLNNGADRRRHPRIPGHQIDAIISDSEGNAIGRVKDISTSGICIEDYPKSRRQISGEITLRAGENSDFRLLIQPRWERVQKSGRVFGASIINHPVGWPIFANLA